MSRPSRMAPRLNLGVRSTSSQLSCARVQLLSTGPVLALYLPDPGGGFNVFAKRGTHSTLRCAEGTGNPNRKRGWNPHGSDHLTQHGNHGQLFRRRPAVVKAAAKAVAAAKGTTKAITKHAATVAEVCVTENINNLPAKCPGVCKQLPLRVHQAI